MFRMTQIHKNSIQFIKRKNLFACQYYFMARLTINQQLRCLNGVKESQQRLRNICQFPRYLHYSEKNGYYFYPVCNMNFFAIRNKLFNVCNKLNVSIGILTKSLRNETKLILFILAIVCSPCKHFNLEIESTPLFRFKSLRRFFQPGQ